jgi:hypothetical protein
MYFDKDRVDSVGALTDGGTLEWGVGQVVDVKRLILVTTTAYTVANDTVTVSVRDVDNGNSVTIGTFVITFAGSAADDVRFVNLGEPETAGSISPIDGSLIFDNEPGGLLRINPGQELVIVDGGQQTAGASALYVEYIPGGFQEYADSAYSPAEMPFTHA